MLIELNFLLEVIQFKGKIEIGKGYDKTFNLYRNDLRIALNEEQVKRIAEIYEEKLVEI